MVWRGAPALTSKTSVITESRPQERTPNMTHHLRCLGQVSPETHIHTHTHPHTFLLSGASALLSPRAAAGGSSPSRMGGGHVATCLGQERDIETQKKSSLACKMLDANCLNAALWQSVGVSLRDPHVDWKCAASRAKPVAAMSTTWQRQARFSQVFSCIVRGHFF